MYLSKTDVNNTIENTSTTLPITPIIFNKWSGQSWSYIGGLFSSLLIRR
jgi:hypothetical protein